MSIFKSAQVCQIVTRHDPGKLLAVCHLGTLGSIILPPVGSDHAVRYVLCELLSIVFTTSALSASRTGSHANGGKWTVDILKQRAEFLTQGFHIRCHLSRVVVKMTADITMLILRCLSYVIRALLGQLFCPR